MKHWLINTHWIEIVKKSGPVGELIPGLSMSGRELCHWATRDHSGPKGNKTRLFFILNTCNFCFQFQLSLSGWWDRIYHELMNLWYNGVVSLLPPSQYIPTLLTHPNHINIYIHTPSHTPHPTKIHPHLHPNFSKISWNPCFGFKTYSKLQLIRLLHLIKFDIRNKFSRHNLINRWSGWLALIHSSLLHLRFSTRTTLVEYNSSILCNNLCYGP